MATIIAMIAPIRIVPQNSGIEPNAPDEPAWSARIAVCGLQVRPNRKSVGGTCWKKRMDFEQQRKDDSERREDRDQGSADEQSVHPTLDRSACAKVPVALAEEHDARASEGDQDRSDPADRGVAALRFRDSRSERGRLRIEARFDLAIRDLPRLGKDRVALHFEVGQRLAFGRREHGLR